MRFIYTLLIAISILSCSTTKQPVQQAEVKPVPESPRKPQGLPELDSIPATALRGYQYAKASNGRDSIQYFVIDDEQTFKSYIKPLEGRRATPVNFAEEVVIGAYRNDMKPARFVVENISLKNNELKIMLSSKNGMTREIGAIPGYFGKINKVHFNRVVFYNNGAEVYKQLLE